MADDKSLKHDALVGRIVGDPAKPADTIWLTGFLGSSSEDGHTRVYSDPSFESYVDVPTDAIIHTEPLPKDQSPLGGSYVWLKKDAEVLHGKVGTERKKAKFLEGPIQAAFAGTGSGAAAPAVGPGGGVGILPTDNPGCPHTQFPPQCGPISDFVACNSPNLWGCHSPLPFCHSAIDACPTRIPQFCPTHFPQFCPSHLRPCPTQHPHPCPSFAPSPCPPSPPPLLCPHTPWPHLCPPTPLCQTVILQQCIHPPITVNNQECVASGGGVGCPVTPGITPQTPQVHPGGAPIQAFGAGGGAPQPPSVAPQACVSVGHVCVTGIQCFPSPQCPPTPLHAGCVSPFPHQCFTPQCPPTPLHGPCISPFPHQCFTPACFTPHCPPTPQHGPCVSAGHVCFTPLCFTPQCPPTPQHAPCPPSPAPHLCFSPLPQCQHVTPFCPVSPQCPISPGCPTLNCPVSPNCPPATGGCPFGPGGGGGPQF